MAYSGKEIEKQAARQGLRFIQTCKSSDGEILEMEAEYKPQSEMPRRISTLYKRKTFSCAVELTVHIHGQIKVL